MSRSTLIPLLLLLGFTSCKPVIKMIYGVKKPKPKTDAQVMEYAQKVFDEEYEMYRPIDTVAYSKLLELDLNKVPDIVFFDSNGFQKSIHEDTLNTCTANADSFLRQLSLLDDAPSMDLQKEEVIPLLRKINLIEAEEKKRDYQNSVIIVWADWIGPKLNREKTSEWLKVYNELDEQQKDNIDLKILNLDMLEGMK